MRKYDSLSISIKLIAYQLSLLKTEQALQFDYADISILSSQSPALQGEMYYVTGNFFFLQEEGPY